MVENAATGGPNNRQSSDCGSSKTMPAARLPPPAAGMKRHARPSPTAVKRFSLLARHITGFRQTTRPRHARHLFVRCQPTLSLSISILSVAIPMAAPVASTKSSFGGRLPPRPNHRTANKGLDPSRSRPCWRISLPRDQRSKITTSEGAPENVSLASTIITSPIIRDGEQGSTKLELIHGLVGKFHCIKDQPFGRCTRLKCEKSIIQIRVSWRRR